MPGFPGDHHLAEAYRGGGGGFFSCLIYTGDGITLPHLASEKQVAQEGVVSSPRSPGWRGAGIHTQDSVTTTPLPFPPGCAAPLHGCPVPVAKGNLPPGPAVTPPGA